MIHDLEPVAFVAAREFPVHLAAGGAKIAFHLDLEFRIGAAAHQFLDELAALVGRNEVQRFFSHGARQFVADHLEHFFFDVICDVDPCECVHGAFGFAGVFLQTLFQQTHHGTFCAADRAVQQNHTAFRPVVAGGGFKGIDQVGKALIDTVHGIAPIVGVIPEETVARDLLLVLDVLLDAVRDDHVVNPLERVPRHARTFLDELEIVL